MTIRFDELARKEMHSAFNDSDFQWNGLPVRTMRVIPIPVKEARKYIATFHYSATMPDSTRFTYAGFLGDRLCGIICYGMGCGKNQYTSLFPDIKNGHYLELTRLWCPDDMPKNTESKLISQSLKQLPPEIEVVISFSDESKSHSGTIYQATNWHYVGVNKGGRMLAKDGIEKHPRLLSIYRMRHPELKDMPTEELRKLLGYEYVPAGRKHKYVYLRGRRRRALYHQIKDRILPYPKFDKAVGLTEAEIIRNWSTEIDPEDSVQISLFDLIENAI